MTQGLADAVTVELLPHRAENRAEGQVHMMLVNVHLVLSSVLAPVREQLDRYGISKALGQDAYFDTPGEAFEAFHSTVR